MILCSRLGEEEITVPIREEEKKAYLQLARIKAKEKLLESNYSYIIYGKSKKDVLYLVTELTNERPLECKYYLSKGEL